MKTYQGHKNDRYSLSGAFASYGGESEKTERKAAVVSGSEDGRLVWWDVVSKEILGEKKAHDGVVLSVDGRMDDGLIVSCGVDRTVRIWERDSSGMEEGLAGMDVIEVNGDPGAPDRGLSASQANGHAANGVANGQLNGDMDVDTQ